MEYLTVGCRVAVYLNVMQKQSQCQGGGGGGYSPKNCMWMCLPNFKNLTLFTNFLLNYPLISIPFWIEKHPILPFCPSSVLFTIICSKYTQFLNFAPCLLWKPIGIPNFAKKHPKAGTLYHVNERTPFPRKPIERHITYCFSLFFGVEEANEIRKSSLISCSPIKLGFAYFRSSSSWFTLLHSECTIPQPLMDTMNIVYELDFWKHGSLCILLLYFAVFKLVKEYFFFTCTTSRLSQAGILLATVQPSFLDEQLSF